MKTPKTSLLHGVAVGFFMSALWSHALAQTSTATSNQHAMEAAAHTPFVSPEPSSPVDSSLAEMEKFVLLVRQLEDEHGPFDQRLSEVLEAAGSAAEREGQYRQALHYYERALHVTRINSGLYSQDQISLVEKMIDSNIALENWTTVDNHYRYLHLLYSRLYSEDSPELRRGLAQISDWHVLAINNDFGTDRIDHLREANKLFKQRLNLVDGELSNDDPVMHTLRYNIAVTQYHLQMIAGGGGNDAIFDRLEEQYEDQLASLD